MKVYLSLINLELKTSCHKQVLGSVKTIIWIKVIVELFETEHILTRPVLGGAKTKNESISSNNLKNYAHPTS